MRRRSYGQFEIPERTPAPMGPPVVVVPDIRLPLAVGMGVIGGLFFGKKAVDHLFREGMTSEERRNLLIFSGSILALYAAGNLIDLDKRWYSVDAWLQPEEPTDQKSGQTP